MPVLTGVADEGFGDGCAPPAPRAPPASATSTSASDTIGDSGGEPGGDVAGAVASPDADTTATPRLLSFLDDAFDALAARAPRRESRSTSRLRMSRRSSASPSCCA